MHFRVKNIYRMLLTRREDVDIEMGIQSCTITVSIKSSAGYNSATFLAQHQLRQLNRGRQHHE